MSIYVCSFKFVLGLVAGWSVTGVVFVVFSFFMGIFNVSDCVVLFDLDLILIVFTVVCLDILLFSHSSLMVKLMKCVNSR